MHLTHQVIMCIHSYEETETAIYAFAFM